MSEIAFFLMTTLIWGTTWLAIKFQLDTVSPIWSVSYRFALAGLILLGFCALTKRSLRFSWAQHGAIALQGIFLFSLNYILLYVSSEYLVSGLVAVLFGSITLMNSLNSRLIFQTPLKPLVLIGSIIGLIGLMLVFRSEINVQSTFSLHHSIFALVIGIFATYLGSLGNMASVANQKQELPIIQTNALGMLYGGIFTALLASILKIKIGFDFSPHYLFSLLYLTIFGSIFAFGFYISLIGRIGAERTAYIGVATPIIAVFISTFFETFNWQLATMVGIALVVFGNVLVLRRKWFNNNL